MWRISGFLLLSVEGLFQEWEETSEVLKIIFIVKERSYTNWLFPTGIFVFTVCQLQLSTLHTSFMCTFQEDKCQTLPQFYSASYPSL